MNDKHREAATHLFGNRNGYPRIPDRLVEAVTADDLGNVPQELIDQGFLELSHYDQDQIMRFRAFLRSMELIEVVDAMTKDGNR